MSGVFKVSKWRQIIKSITVARKKSYWLRGTKAPEVLSQRHLFGIWSTLITCTTVTALLLTALVQLPAWYLCISSNYNQHTALSIKPLQVAVIPRLHHWKCVVSFPTRAIKQTKKKILKKSVWKLQKINLKISNSTRTCIKIPISSIIIKPCSQSNNNI